MINRGKAVILLSLLSNIGPVLVTSKEVLSRVTRMIPLPLHISGYEMLSLEVSDWMLV